MTVPTSQSPPNLADSSTSATAVEQHAWPYVLPLGIFLLLTSFESFLPRSAAGGAHPVYYPVFYALKIALVIAMLVVARRTWSDFRPFPRFPQLAASVLLGLVVAAVWIGLERLPYPRLPLTGSREAFDPLLLSPAMKGLFLAVRLLGLVAVVPVVEELFWRSFLMRWIADPEFWKVPVGRVTAVAAGVTSIFFAAAHPEWLPALLTGLGWAGLLAWSGRLSACLVSHAVANLALGAYVLATHSWRLW